MSDKQDRQKEIEKLAYEKWERAGSPHGQHGGFWAEAEKEYDAAQAAKVVDSTTAAVTGGSGHARPAGAQTALPPGLVGHQHKATTTRPPR